MKGIFLLFLNIFRQVYVLVYNPSRKTHGYVSGGMKAMEMPHSSVNIINPGRFF